MLSLLCSGVTSYTWIRYNVILLFFTQTYPRCSLLQVMFLNARETFALKRLVRFGLSALEQLVGFGLSAIISAVFFELEHLHRTEALLSLLAPYRTWLMHRSIPILPVGYITTGISAGQRPNIQ